MGSQLRAKSVGGERKGGPDSQGTRQLIFDLDRYTFFAYPPDDGKYEGAQAKW